jgi:type IV pilus assembly protein PilW
MNSHTIAHRHGFTLIEILIAMTIAAMLLSGVVYFTQANSQAFRVQQDLVQIQEQERFATSVMEYHIRMIDHWGSASWQMPATLPSVAARGDCDKAWIFNGDRPLQAFEGGDTPTSAGFPDDCVLKSDYIAGSDAFVTRFAEDQAIRNADAIDTQVYWRVTAGTRGEFVLGSSIDKTAPDSNSVLLYPYNVSMFAIRPCYITPGNQDCQDTADGGQPIPSLVRYYLDGTTVSVERILAGVEDFQLEYGVELVEKDGVGVCWLEGHELADIAKNCSAEVTSAPTWDDILYVRFSMLIRSNSKDASFADFTQYRLLREDQTYKPKGDAKHYRRKQITRTVRIRNRSKLDARIDEA